MAIPVYRQNTEYDDWEVASVYDSDDCDSLGRSASYESSHRSSSLDHPFQLQGPFYEDARPADYVVPHPPTQQQQHQNYPLVTMTRSRRDTCHVPGERSNFVLPPAPIVPPPGVIFPPKEWVLAPQDMHRPCTTGRIASSGMTVDMALIEPPPSSLLLSPCSPPCGPSPLGRPSPTRTIGHSQAPVTGANVNTCASPIMAPRYHEPVHGISPRLAEAGCQAHPGMTMSPRRSGHDILLSCGPEASMPRGSQTNEEMMMVAEERCGGRPGGGGHSSYGAGDRPDLHPRPGSSRYEYEHASGCDARRMRRTRPPTRERRPSMWQRFVRRFSPSRRVSVGHT